MNPLLLELVIYLIGLYPASNLYGYTVERIGRNYMFNKATATLFSWSTVVSCILILIYIRAQPIILFLIKAKFYYRINRKIGYGAHTLIIQRDAHTGNYQIEMLKPQSSPVTMDSMFIDLYRAYEEELKKRLLDSSYKAGVKPVVSPYVFKEPANYN